MNNLYDQLMLDVRFQEGLKACMNCGTCTALCAAANFYNYHPRRIVDIVQNKDEIAIKELLCSDEIWYCGECMSCKTRCPRGNVPGLIIMALRSLSQDLGFFVESEKGRQQLAVKRTVGQWILDFGYCLYLEGVGTNMHPEQGPIWDWVQENWEDHLARLGANYKGEGPGILRKIPEESMEEIRRIFEITGGNKRFETIEKFSKQKAEEMHLDFGQDLENDYFKHIYSFNNQKHMKP